MKLKGISADGLRRVSQTQPKRAQHSDLEVYEFVDDALEALGKIDDDLLTDIGVEELNKAYSTLMEFKENLTGFTRW